MTFALSLPDLEAQLALVLRATLLIAVAWAASAALRKAGASAASRHMAWLLGIAALLTMPMLWLLIPALRLPILPAEAATGAAAGPPPASDPASFTPAEPVASEVTADSVLGLVFLAVYCFGACTLLLRLVVGRRMLRRLWSDSVTVRDPAWEELLSRLSFGMGLSRPVELRISRGPAVPMTWGTLRPKVLLPADAFEWPPERRRLVLLHELAHVARRDSFARSAASLACALYWFHPGIWFAARQMRLEQEHAADDRVLMAGGSPQSYALNLLHLARESGASHRFGPAAAMAGMYQLEQRLVSITGPARRNRSGSFFLSSSALLAGLTTFVVATAVPVGASPTLGLLRTGGTGPASPSQEVLEQRSAGETSREAGQAGERLEAVERGASVSAAASQIRSKGPASKGMEIAKVVGAPRSIESQPTDSADERSRDRRESPSNEQPIRNYGWELPRRDSKVQIVSDAASSRPARLTLPTPVESASSERTGRRKWARNVPRLVVGDPSRRSPVPAAQAPLMLSWSVEVGGK